MNDVIRALAIAAGFLLPVVILIVIVSIVAVKRGEASMRGAGTGHGEHGEPTPASAGTPAPAAAKTGKAAPVDEINVGQILIYGVGLFTLTILALLGVSLIQHMN